MSLQRRLVISLSLGLLVSLLVGAGLTYLHAIAKVRTEMVAALALARHQVDTALHDVEPINPARIVGNFNGDRHLIAMLLGEDGRVTLSSNLPKPEEPAPHMFYDLVAGPALQADMPLPPAFAGPGLIRLQTDPHNEVAEAWSDLRLGLAILGLFFVVALGLMIWMVRRIMLPLQELCRGLARIGAGEYDARLLARSYRELLPVQQSFNEMAARLARIEAQNRLLQAQIQQVQEEERAELARDLHDEIAPFLFTVGADAALIRQFIGNGAYGEIDGSAQSIVVSVRHMQKHLKTLLSRLMPNALVELGLPGAIEALAAFWKTRRPDIEFSVCAGAGPMDERSRSVIFRVVQESLSNAVRHGAPTKVAVAIRDCGEAIEVDISDNGRGLPQSWGSPCFGVLGMQERVRSVGGLLCVGNRSDGEGVAVRARLPREAESCASS